MTDVSKLSTLAEALPSEQARVRKLMALYREVCPREGAFALVMMEQAMHRADVAAVAGDVVEMMRSLQELREFTE